jgi:hypothetical protein
MFRVLQLFLSSGGWGRLSVGVRSYKGAQYGEWLRSLTWRFKQIHFSICCLYCLFAVPDNRWSPQTPCLCYTSSPEHSTVCYICRFFEVKNKISHTYKKLNCIFNILFNIIFPHPVARHLFHDGQLGRIMLWRNFQAILRYFYKNFVAM